HGHRAAERKRAARPQLGQLIGGERQHGGHDEQAIAQGHQRSSDTTAAQRSSRGPCAGVYFQQRSQRWPGAWSTVSSESVASSPSSTTETPNRSASSSRAPASTARSAAAGRIVTRASSGWCFWARNGSSALSARSR